MMFYLKKGSKDSLTHNDTCFSTQNIKAVYGFSDPGVMFWVVSIQGFLED